MNKDKLEYIVAIVRGTMQSAKPDLSWSIIIEVDQGRSPQGPGVKIEVSQNGVMVRDSR